MLKSVNPIFVMIHLKNGQRLDKDVFFEEWPEIPWILMWIFVCNFLRFSRARKKRENKEVFAGEGEEDEEVGTKKVYRWKKSFNCYTKKNIV